MAKKYKYERIERVITREGFNSFLDEFSSREIIWYDEFWMDGTRVRIRMLVK